ncbi:alpha/beta hydrolase [Alkalilimnicola ehrlichii MLHE-1]|uniref:Carboxylesterase n=1 Tax=Alkalilimnicola ehrlichii (strain ATCC BAA-1101 / DSM 17681 / MLHE-1) TaxID=187272 RepID=Q0AC71_ALKEH|nr:carboxylesterase [Alkalilimnicola ehrlichii]ABI55566.1 Carboxylesterase [Alkalilimnicola ehrlichii MLHE-1]
MDSQRLERVEVSTGANPTASVIWLHGLGADGHDFEPIVPELRKTAAQGAVRFVFPHAPKRPVTVNGGAVMRAWYDLYDLGINRAGEDEAGIREAMDLVRGLVDEEKARGVPAGRIVLAGFSMGGAAALFSGLRHDERLAGLMGLSCYLPLADRLADERDPANSGTSVLLVHGSYDPVLPMPLGVAARDTLQGLGYPVEWQDYPMEHQVCMEEIALVDDWLSRVLSD